MCTRVYNSAIEEGNLATATTWMDLEGIMLSEISQEKDKYCMISHVESKIETKKQLIDEEN